MMTPAILWKKKQPSDKWTAYLAFGPAISSEIVFDDEPHAVAQKQTIVLADVQNDYHLVLSDGSIWVEVDFRVTYVIDREDGEKIPIDVEYVDQRLLDGPVETIPVETVAV